MLSSILENKGILSKRLLELEVFTFLDAIQFVKSLPYGRTSDRSNPDLVLKELKGTCSTKHAVLKKIAIEQSYDEVRLFLCLFKMNGNNTPKLSGILNKYNVQYIPEAHCVLKIDNDFIDVTNAASNYDNLKDDVLELIDIQPEQIGAFKVNYHQTYLKKWLEENNTEYTFDEFWTIREECINVLSS
jgi:hypothetical protein